MRKIRKRRRKIRIAAVHSVSVYKFKSTYKKKRRENEEEEEIISMKKLEEHDEIIKKKSPLFRKFIWRKKDKYLKKELRVFNIKIYSSLDKETRKYLKLLLMFLCTRNDEVKEEVEKEDEENNYWINAPAPRNANIVADLEIQRMCKNNIY